MHKSNGVQPGQHYVGLDISLKTTSACVVDSMGKILDESQVLTGVAELSKYMKDLDLNITNVGIEAGAMSRHLVRGLREEGLPVTCIDSHKMSCILAARPNKTDKNDARAIADAMRVGIYTPVHIKSEKATNLADILQVRHGAMKQRTETKNQVRAMFREKGIKLGVVSHVKFVEKVRTMGQKRPAILSLVEPLLRLFELQQEVCLELDQKVRSIASSDERMVLLQTTPGVGPVTAMAFVAEIDDPYRFKKSPTVGAYVGMTPKQNSSGESQRMGRISCRGNKMMRSLLYEAGIVILTRSQKWSKLKAWGLRIAKRSGMKKAAVAVGRKLAVILHKMLKTGETFRFGGAKA